MRKVNFWSFLIPLVHFLEKFMSLMHVIPCLHKAWFLHHHICVLYKFLRLLMFGYLVLPSMVQTRDILTTFRGIQTIIIFVHIKLLKESNLRLLDIILPYHCIKTWVYVVGLYRTIFYILHSNGHIANRAQQESYDFIFI